MGSTYIDGPNPPGGWRSPPEPTKPPAARPTLTYDGWGINGPDEHRTRLATFSTGAAGERWGPLLALAPDLLAALGALEARIREGTYILNQIALDYHRADVDAALVELKTARALLTGLGVVL